MTFVLFSLTPFFWVVNVSATKLAAWRSPANSVASKNLWLQLKAVSARRNGVLSDLGAVYSLGQRRSN